MAVPADAVAGMTPGSSTPAVMPAFIGHGNPMNALEINRYSAARQAFGQAVPDASIPVVHLKAAVPPRRPVP